MTHPLDKDMIGRTTDAMINTMATGNMIIMTAGIITIMIIIMSSMKGIINALLKVMKETIILTIAMATTAIMLFIAM